MKKLLLTFLLLCIPSLVFAQSSIGAVRPVTASATLSTPSSGTCLYTTDCVKINLGGYKFIALQLTGTFVGTLTFESSVDGGTTWVTQNVLPSTGTQTAVTTATAVGVWYATAQAAQFRVRFSTATSGSVAVTLRATL